MRSIAWVAVAFAVAPACHAHESLQHFVHQTAVFTIAENSIDVAINVDFYGEHAAVERSRMDSDHDGRISSEEWNAYQATIARETADAIEVMVGETALTTIALYDPEVSLHDDWSRSDAPVTVRLDFFVRRSPNVSGEVWMQDTLWLDMPALCLTKNAAAAGPAEPMTRVLAGKSRQHRSGETIGKGDP